MAVQRQYNVSKEQCETSSAVVHGIARRISEVTCRLHLTHHLEAVQWQYSGSTAAVHSSCQVQ
jgi:hypothetical protein